MSSPTWNRAPSSHGRHAAPPEVRRSPWNRPRDRVIAGALTVLLVTAAVVVWTFSDSRATTQETAGEPRNLPPAPSGVPATLTEVWRAESPATPEPVAEDHTVVTAGHGEVVGRDPRTGAVRWRYDRDIALCTVAGSGSHAIAVYRKNTGCSEVTQLDAGTGERTAQRNSDAELGTRLITDGGHITTTGKRLVNTWRNDLVKTMEYGKVFALTNPDRQPRTGCTYSSVAAHSGKVGVLEHCPDEPGDRLTVLEAAPKDWDKPEEVYSTLLRDDRARLIAMSGDYAVVAKPQQRLLTIYGPEGTPHREYPLDVPAADLAREPAGGVVPTARGVDNVYWFTGSRTMALSEKDLTPQWTLEGTLGPGTVFAGEYVVPIPGGLAVLNERTGETVRTVGVDRRGSTGPVELAAIGPFLLEQRGNTLVALTDS